MRNTPHRLVLAIGLSLPLTAQAQGTLQVSNLDQTPTRSTVLGSDAWIAARFSLFVTDPDIYALDGVQLLMDPASGNPSGFSASIYGESNGIPQVHLGDLIGADDPSSAGIYTYSASGITIEAGQPYYVVAKAETPVTQGAYYWSGVDIGTQNGTWVIGSRCFSSEDGQSWTVLGRNVVFQMALYATVVPEPGTCALLGLGLAAFAYRRWRSNSG